VLVHERVLEAIMERGPVLPLRFGTQLGSEQELAITLSQRREEWSAALERVRGRVELGIRVLAERPERPRGGGSGREYLLNRVAEHRRAEMAARELHVPLDELAVVSQLSEHPSPPAVVVGSYLVAEGSVDGFRSRAEALAKRHDDLRVVVTGPWPPYSFAGEEG